jgi:DNA polymerase-3 subunit epsilon
MEVNGRAADRLVASLLRDARFIRENGGWTLVEWRLPFPPNGPVVVLDLETTGGSPDADEIIEIGAIRVGSNGAGGEFQSLVYPGRTLPEGIVALTGITEEMLAGAPSPAEALSALHRFIGDATVAIQHAPFDLGFLRPRFAGLGLPFENHVVDTVQLARRALPDVQRRGLDALMTAFGVAPVTRHRALEDARATAQVLRHLYYLLCDRSPVAWDRL